MRLLTVSMHENWAHSATVCQVLTRSGRSHLFIRLLTLICFASKDAARHTSTFSSCERGGSFVTIFVVQGTSTRLEDGAC